MKQLRLVRCVSAEKEDERLLPLLSLGFAALFFGLFLAVTGRDDHQRRRLTPWSSYKCDTDSAKTFVDEVNSALECGKDKSLDECFEKLETMYSKFSNEDVERAENEDFDEEQSKRAEILRNKWLSETVQYTRKVAWERHAMRDDLYQREPTVDTSNVLAGLGESSHKPKEEWKSMHFPDFTVAGFPLCGNAHLRNIIKGFNPYNIHDFPVLSPFSYSYLLGNSYNDSEKEEMQAKLYQYYDEMATPGPLPPPPDSDDDPDISLTISTNAYVDDAILRADYLGVPRTGKGSPKFILIFRDPANWIWSHWNYYVDKHLDKNAKTADGKTRSRAEETVDYRSPELFHELVSSGNRTMSGLALLDRRNATIETPRKLLQAFGKDNVMFVKREEMVGTDEQREEFLQSLQNFLGFKIPEKNIDELRDELVVGGRSKWTDIDYQIAGYRGMFNETRNLLYLYFKEECDIWNRQFGVEYSDCVHVLEHY